MVSHHLLQVVKTFSRPAMDNAIPFSELRLVGPAHFLVVENVKYFFLYISMLERMRRNIYSAAAGWALRLLRWTRVFGLSLFKILFLYHWYSKIMCIVIISPKVIFLYNTWILLLPVSPRGSIGLPSTLFVFFYTCVQRTAFS